MLKLSNKLLDILQISPVIHVKWHHSHQSMLLHCCSNLFQCPSQKLHRKVEEGRQALKYMGSLCVQGPKYRWLVALGDSKHINIFLAWEGLQPSHQASQEWPDDNLWKLLPSWYFQHHLPQCSLPSQIVRKLLTTGLYMPHQQFPWTWNQECHNLWKLSRNSYILVWVTWKVEEDFEPTGYNKPVKLWIHVIFSGRKRCGVEIRMGWKKVRMFPVTDKGLASTYVLCHPSPMCPWLRTERETKRERERKEGWTKLIFETD